MTTPHAKAAEEVARAIVAKHLAVTQDSGTLERAIAAAIRDKYERGLTIGFDRGQGWSKTREGAMERAGLVFDGEDKIVTRPGHILDDAGNVLAGKWEYADTSATSTRFVFVPDYASETTAISESIKRARRACDDDLPAQGAKSE